MRDHIVEFQKSHCYCSFNFSFEAEHALAVLLVFRKLSLAMKSILINICHTFMCSLYCSLFSFFVCCFVLYCFILNSLLYFDAMNAVDERYLLQLRRGPKRTEQIFVYARLNELVVFGRFLDVVKLVMMNEISFAF